MQVIRDWSVILETLRYACTGACFFGVLRME